MPDEWIYVVTDIETDGPWPGAHSMRLCLRGCAAALTGRPVAEVTPQTLPARWSGEIAHTHRSIDDARGYAHLLGVLFRAAAPLSS